MAQAAQRTASGAGAANGSSNAAAGTAGASTASNKDIPRDARIIGLILASLGVTDAEPGVVAMLLEFAHRELHEFSNLNNINTLHATWS
jgi:transcription initiation factor TFIID subunit 9B